MMTNKIRSTILATAYLIAGAILFAADTISHGGSYCGVLGIIALIVGTLLSLKEPLKKILCFIFQSADPS